ncbi:MAG: hypothetical protein JST44_11910 [Cyanobacteria bacterium SZAS LIN-5]|nr:hypothetical protein [Cyanobacteria bacterium SZAS LIN-5]
MKIALKHFRRDVNISKRREVLRILQLAMPIEGSSQQVTQPLAQLHEEFQTELNRQIGAFIISV